MWHLHGGGRQHWEGNRGTCFPRLTCSSVQLPLIRLDLLPSNTCTPCPLQPMGGSQGRQMASGNCGHVYCYDCLVAAVRTQVWEACDQHKLLEGTSGLPLRLAASAPFMHAFC